MAGGWEGHEPQETSRFISNVIERYDIESDIINDLDILGEKKQLTHIVEEIRNSTYGWNFTNHYWLDDNYFVWKSIQTVNPKIPSFELIVTKKPST